MFLLDFKISLEYKFHIKSYTLQFIHVTIANVLESLHFNFGGQFLHSLEIKSDKNIWCKTKHVLFSTSSWSSQKTSEIAHSTPQDITWLTKWTLENLKSHKYLNIQSGVKRYTKLTCLNIQFLKVYKKNKYENICEAVKNFVFLPYAFKVTWPDPGTIPDGILTTNWSATIPSSVFMLISIREETE